MKIRFLIATILTTSALHADVLHVASDGTGDYVEIQPAVDAAADGDTILVQPTGWWYDPFTVVDKDLAIVSAVLGQHAQVRGFRILDLSDDKQVLVGRLRSVANWPWSDAALEIENCAGSVRVDECVLRTDILVDGTVVEDSSDVSFVACILEGGDGIFDEIESLVGGGHALHAKDSRLAVTGCTLTGGQGSEYDSGSGVICGDGGSGLRLVGGFAWVSASILAGGDATCGAPGSAVFSTGEARLQDNTLLGGTQGAVSLVPGRARVLEGPVFEADGVSTIRLSGKPGDRVVLFWSTTPDFRYLRRQRGVLLGAPPFGLADEGWVVDASGELEFTWTPPTAPPGEGRVLHLQARIDRGGAVPRLTNVAAMLVVDWP